MARGRRFSSGSARAAGARRLTNWELGPGGDDLPTWDRISFTSSSQAILGSGVTPINPNLTIIRIHGTVNIALRVADASLSGFNYAMGIGVVTLDAFTAGIGSVPKPFDDISWPGWMWHHMGALHSPVGALVQDMGAQKVLNFESKSMRKLRLNEVLMWVVQVGESGASTIDFEGATRVLVKLP